MVASLAAGARADKSENAGIDLIVSVDYGSRARNIPITFVPIDGRRAPRNHGRDPRQHRVETSPSIRPTGSPRRARAAARPGRSKGRNGWQREERREGGGGRQESSFLPELSR